MARDSDEQARQEGEQRRRRSVLFSLGLVLAGTGVALILLSRTVPRFGWPAFLAGLLELVGAVLALGGVVLAGWAVRER